MARPKNFPDTLYVSRQQDKADKSTYFLPSRELHEVDSEASEVAVYKLVSFGKVDVTYKFTETKKAK